MTMHKPFFADLTRGQIPFVLVGSGRSLAVYRRGLRVIGNHTGAAGVLKSAN